MCLRGDGDARTQVIVDLAESLLGQCGASLGELLVDRTAIQLPSTEGVQEIDMDKGEIIAASYGYYPAPDYGRYTVNKAYSLEGKFLRQVGEPQPE